MATRIKPQAKAFLVIVGLAVLFFGLRAAMQHGLIPTPGIMKSVVASKVNLPNQEDAKVQGVAPIAYPSTSEAHVSANRLVIDEWEWNAENAVHLANGAADTTKGSLMEKFGVNLHLQRQDSNDQMKKDLLACAEQLHNGDQTCTSGAAAILVMGDSAGQWLADMNPQLAKLGMKLKIVGANGRSNGEDALLGPAEWKDNPQSMKGKTIVGVIRDGDWNIALAFEGFNNLKNNPDLTTYDPDAVNWISAPDDDYIKAVTEVYIPNKCETRKVVRNGKLTGDKPVQVCPDGVVTWTPGDEQAVHGRSGTAKIISSREYSAQMPNVVLILDKFASQNRDEIAGFFAATWTAADQIKAYDAALRKASEIAAKIYNDQNADYWFNYAKGTRDKSTGQPLGGSAVFNLQDNLQYFGLAEGYQNNMKATYETFARIDVEQYPTLFTKEHAIPAYKDAVDTSFIRAAQDLLSNSGSTGAAADSVDYTAAVSQGSQVSKAAVYISFATGSAQLTPAGQAQLQELAQQLGIAKSLALQIDGYTDNTGSDSVNIPLSAARARAVKAFLQQTARHDFPESRFKSVEGHGSQSPIAPNDTADDKAKNRRVEIIQIGSNS